MQKLGEIKEAEALRDSERHRAETRRQTRTDAARTRRQRQRAV